MEHNSDLKNEAPVATVRRLTTVLDAFLQADDDLGVTELANQLGMAKSVVHRFVTALTEAEYLSQSPGSRRYRLGSKAVRLGLAALGRANIRRRALAHLQALAAETGETATLSLLVGDHRVYAEQVESLHPVRQTVRLGESVPLYAGASSKAILAFLPEEQQVSLLRQAEAGTSHASGAGVDVRKLTRELEEIRRRGYATSCSERVLGAASAAAPVFDYYGNVAGSLSLAGVTVRHGPAELAKFGELVRAHAYRLSEELGWSASESVLVP